MKVKYSFVFSFCLMLFITFTPSISKADIIDNYNNNQSYYNDIYKNNDGYNVFVVSGSNSEHTIEQYWTFKSLEPLNISLRWSNTYNTYTFSSSSCNLYMIKYTKDAETGVWKTNENDYGTVVSGTVPSSSATHDMTYIKSGDVNLNIDSSNPGTIASSGGLGNFPSISPSDILNFNWQGDGIKIYNLSENMNVSGYSDNTIKYFDIETYGKFIYKGDNTFFTSIAYKKMQTSIQLASVVNFGDLTRRTGEGLGIKKFEWVSNTSQLNNGDEVKFRIVYQVPMLDKGVYNVKIGTTINNGIFDAWLDDYVNNVNFLNSNWNYNEPLDNSGETGNVGNSPGNTPNVEQGGYSSDWTTNFTTVITMFSSFNGFIGSLFGFLPTEIKILFGVVCTIIVGLMVKRAVL